MKKMILIPLLLCFLLACSDDSSDSNHSSVFIRLRNTSAFQYMDAYVNTGGGEFTYGTINANDTSPYHPFESAYRYAYVSLKIDGVEYKIQPIDYVGEKNLDNGVYTYEISAKANGGQYDKLTMELVKD